MKNTWAWASLLAGLSMNAGCTVTPTYDADLLDGGRARGFGEGCATTEDCASGLCLDVGVRSICTEVCVSDSDCPTAPNWGCVAPEDLDDARVCGCNGGASTEVCGNRLDDDCNGEVDECRMCDGVPVAEDDPAHCGACGNRCRDDQECSSGMCRCLAGITDCGGACVDTATSPAHCGACGRACESGSTCIGGDCTCADPLTELCPGVGCVELSRSFVHCGACGNRCPSGGACRDGTCVCIDPGATVCDGACVDLDTDPGNCGRCGDACSATEQCVGGVCRCPSATPDRCGTECVDLRLDPANCGACGVLCAPGARCLARACSCFAGAGHVCGDGVCHPPGDEANCGGCGLVCPAGQNCDDGAGACYCNATARPPCADGSCPDVSSDVSNCGACGNVCRIGEPCVSGACTCPSGTTYCVGSGCVSTASDPMNCGGCGLSCQPGQICSRGACVCPTGTMLCPGIGCVSVNDPMNCGGCGMACAIGQTCFTSRCMCPTGSPTVCGGACTNPSTDPNNCGVCGNVCPSGTTCSGGACRCPRAGLGELYCESDMACVDTRTSTAHCGACDRACPAEARCTSGTCICSTAGEIACGTSCVDPFTDEANCGSCGRVCSGSLVCRGGTCACDPPVPGTPERLTTADGSSERVAVAWNGTDSVLVVWRDNRSGVFQTYAQRVGTDGTALGAATVLSAAPSPGVQHVDVVWTGAEWGVSWSQSAASSREDVFLTRLAASGSVITGPTPMRSDWRANYMRLLFTPMLGYVLMRGPDTSLQAFGPLGTTPGTVLTLPRPASGFVNDCAAASLPSGEIGLLSIGDSLAPGVYFQRVNADGSYTAASVRLRSSYADSPVLAHDGSTWVGAWRETGAVTSILLAHGASLGPGTVVVSGSALYRRPALAVGGTTVMLTWQATGDTVWRIDGRRYRLTGGAPVAVDSAASVYMPTTSVAEQLHGIVGVPGGILLAWADSRWGATEVYDQFVGMTPCAP